MPGDYNGDSRTDIAFRSPGRHWNTMPVVFANGDGTWSSANAPAPSWANEPGVVAMPGDYNGDGLRDIAFRNPGSYWNTMPVSMSDGESPTTTAFATSSTYLAEIDAVDGQRVLTIRMGTAHRDAAGQSTVVIDVDASGNVRINGRVNAITGKNGTPNYLNPALLFPLPG